MAIKTEIKLFGDAIKKALNKFVELEQQRIAPEIVDLIYKRTKSGKDVSGESLLPLSSSYKSYRKKLFAGEQSQQKKPTQGFFETDKKYKSRARKETKNSALKSFGDFFSPNKSNLTLTGQMLDNLNFKIAKGKITIFVKQNKRDDGETNAQVAEWVTKQGRPFLGLSEKQKTVILKQIERDLRNYIRMAFK